MKPETKWFLLICAVVVVLLILYSPGARSAQLQPQVTVHVHCYQAAPLLPEASSTSSINWKSWAEGFFWLATFAGRLLT